MSEPTFTIGADSTEEGLAFVGFRWNGPGVAEVLRVPVDQAAFAAAIDAELLRQRMAAVTLSIGNVPLALHKMRHAAVFIVRAASGSDFARDPGSFRRDAALALLACRQHPETRKALRLLWRGILSPKSLGERWRLR